MANDKVKFRRGTSSEYANATKDNDTIYYTTDDRRLHIGNQEVTSEGTVVVDDTLSDTSEHPVQNKVISEALNGKSETSHIHSNATTSAAGFMSAADKSKLDGVAEGANKYTHPSYTARTGVPTANQTPTFGGTFTVTQPVSDATGHITAMNSRTITIPSTVATTSANGLMSANDKLKLNYTNIAYATCDTAAATAAKAATVSGNSKWSLVVGSIVVVKFSNTNTASSCTLNVNDTGAKQIWYSNSVHTGNSTTVCGAANTFITFMYDGTYWVWIGHSSDYYPSIASATVAGIVSTGTQTFAGQKTFNGSIIPAGASAVGTAQARKIYAGTSDMTAGTTALETGAIYLVYE